MANFFAFFSRSCSSLYSLLIVSAKRWWQAGDAAARKIKGAARVRGLPGARGMLTLVLSRVFASLLLRCEQLPGVGLFPLVKFNACLLNVLLDSLHGIHRAAGGENFDQISVNI